MLKRSSAAAMKVASTVTRAVLRADLSSVFFADLVGAAALAGPGGGVEVDGGTGVEAPETVRSPPCVSMIAAANSENLISRAAGSFDLASEKTASTAGDDAVLSVHSYYREERPLDIRIV